MGYRGHAEKLRSAILKTQKKVISSFTPGMVQMTVFHASSAAGNSAPLFHAFTIKFVQLNYLPTLLTVNVRRIMNSEQDLIRV